MTDQHPLTDETCDGLVWFSLDGLTELSEYDYVIMRAAADWQLECDAEWWKIILNRLEMIHPHVVDSLIEEFKKAMRPTQEDNNE